MYTAITHNEHSTLAYPYTTQVCVIFEARYVAASATNFDHGGFSLDNSADNNNNYHTQSFLDRNDQSHKGSVQVVDDDDEVDDLLRNGDNSHTHL